MNGLEALQALKDGKTVLYKQNKRYGNTDIFFVYRSQLKTEETNKQIWWRYRIDRFWQNTGMDISFWMEKDSFEIADDGEGVQ